MRKALIVSASVASLVIGGCIAAAAGMLQYKPTQQHVEVEIKCDGEPCKVPAR